MVCMHVCMCLCAWCVFMCVCEMHLCWGAGVYLHGAVLRSEHSPGFFPYVCPIFCLG